MFVCLCVCLFVCVFVCCQASQEAEEKLQQLDNLKSELAVRRGCGYSLVLFQRGVLLQNVKKERDNYSQQVPGTPLSGECESLSLVDLLL